MLLCAVFLCSIVTASGQGGRPPMSPCPGVFEYVLADNGYEGLITAPAPALQGTLKLTVKLFTAKILANEQAGSLSRLGDAEEGVLFRLVLPSQEPLSTIDEITANEVNICTGPRVQARSLLRSTITFMLSNYHPSNTRPIGRPPALSTTRRPPSRPDKPSSADAAEECGIAEVDLRQPLIAFGVPTDKGEWPWLAAIFASDNQLLCGGSLLDLRHVITAAHCVQTPQGKLTDKDEVYVIMGKYNLKTINEEGNQMKDISRIRVHPSYDYVKFSDDIALLTLESAVTYSRFVRPICLWKNDFPESKLVNKEAAVVGWGRDQNGNMNTARPEMAKAPIVSRQSCRESEVLKSITNDRTLCAGYKNGTGPCTGDSGGGLMIPNPEKNGNVRYYLQGVVSLALRKRGTRKMCNLHQYAVYTNVNKYLDWLRQYVAENY